MKLKIHDNVYDRNSLQLGEIIEINGKNATIQTNSLIYVSKLKNLELIDFQLIKYKVGDVLRLRSDYTVKEVVKECSGFTYHMEGGFGYLEYELDEYFEKINHWLPSQSVL